MSFAWSPDGQRLAYSRPDSVGVLEFKDGVMSSALEIPPLQTGGDWAWVPGVAWGADGNVLYTVMHSAPEDSQLFHLTAVPLSASSPVELALEAGMFAYPAVSPSKTLQNGEIAYQIAYLRAIFPRQSDTSPYRLVIMDRDGSNQESLFPPQGEPGLEPQQVAWSPTPLPTSGNYAVAVLYQGNLWLVDSDTGDARQLTGDGLIKRINWR
jgi:Tol biopolymer transport system component